MNYDVLLNRIKIFIKIKKFLTNFNFFYDFHIYLNFKNKY